MPGGLTHATGERAMASAGGPGLGPRPTSSPTGGPGADTDPRLAPILDETWWGAQSVGLCSNRLSSGQEETTWRSRATANTSR